MLEVEEVADVGGAPGVDGLVGIADDGEVAVPFCEEAGHHVLGGVGVLELVDQDMQEAFLEALAHGLGLAQQRDHLHEQFVEVEGVVLAKKLLIALVGAGDDLVPVLAGAAGEGLGGQQLALGGGDGAEEGAG